MLFNYLFENTSDLVFYSTFAGMGYFIGYKFISSYINSFYINKSIQTDAWKNYSNRTNQMGSNSVTSINTITPLFLKYKSSFYNSYYFWSKYSNYNW